MTMYYKGKSIIYLGLYPAIHMKFHPGANHDGLVYVHRLVAEEKLGRYLLDGECVHHIDMDKSNYDVHNLMVFASDGDHTRYHNAISNGTNYSLLNLDGVYYCIIGKKFIDEIYDLYIGMIDISAQKRSVCPICGSLKSTHAKTCMNCYRKYDLVYNREPSHMPSKVVLEKILYEYKNFSKIGRIYGVTDNAVRKWCKKCGLPYKASDLKKM